MGEHTPNTRLQILMDHAKLSHHGLARRVNLLGAAAGLDLRYGHTAVARWLAGVTPRGVVPQLIAEAIAAKLGRPVTLAEIGYNSIGAPDPAQGLAFPHSIATTIQNAAVWSTVERRHFLAHVAAWPCAAVYTRPLARWLTNPTDEDVSRSGGPRVGTGDVARLEAQADYARRLDSLLGGAAPSLSVEQCLNDDAVPLFAGTYTDTTGRQLFAATAQLARLAGWTAYDTGNHGLAQTRFVQALRYAKAAGDIPFGAYVLASASLQANYLGDPDTALDLAQGAYAAAKHHATPRVLAFCRLVEARARARAGDRHGTEAALAATEQLLNRPTVDGDDPPWIDFMVPSRLEAAAAEAYLDLGLAPQVIAHTAPALQMPAHAYVRAHGLRLAVLASAHAHAGDRDAACYYGQHAQTIAHQIRSVRLDEYMHRLSGRLIRWHDHPPTRALIDSTAKPILRQRL